jgi:hypothetical protein
MPAAMEALACGSTSTAFSPAISASDEQFDVSTGQPLAIASSTGNPKPSIREGKAKKERVLETGADLTVAQSAREMDAVSHTE